MFFMSSRITIVLIFPVINYCDARLLLWMFSQFDHHHVYHVTHIHALICVSTAASTIIMTMMSYYDYHSSLNHDSHIK